jgi:hypothetical protein
MTILVISTDDVAIWLMKASRSPRVRGSSPKSHLWMIAGANAE